MLKKKQRSVPIRLLCLMATLLAMALPAHATDYYVYGENNGWEQNPDYKFTQSGNQYTLKLNSLSGYWKIVSNGTYYGPHNNSGNWSFSTSGATYTETQSGNDKNFYCGGSKTQTVSDVTITFTEKNNKPFDVKVTYVIMPNALYLVGNKISGNEWDPNNAISLTKSGSTFTLPNVTFGNAGDGYCYFSFLTAKGDWDTVNAQDRIYATSQNALVTVDTPIEFVKGVNPNPDCWKVAAGTYDVTVDFATNKVTLTKSWTGFAPGYPQVYLLSPVLNNNVVSQEWCMETSDYKTFTLKDFALRNSKARNKGNNDWIDQGFVVRVYYGPGENDYIDTKQYSDAETGMFDPSNYWIWTKTDNNNVDDSYPGTPGWGANATFNLVMNGLNADASTLSFESNNPNLEGDNWPLNYLPYLGILGESFVQENEYKTPKKFNKTESDTDAKPNANLMGSTNYGWQEAYIQYNNNSPVIVNGKAQYNTMWPPRHDIRMQFREKNSDGTFKANVLPLNVSTSSLTFHPQLNAGKPEVKTGNEWMTELKNKDADSYNNLSLEAGQYYVHYVAPRMWMKGAFKIWTGWGGQPVQTINNNMPWGAMWNNHLYFSARDNAESDQTMEEGVTYESSACVNNKNFNIANRSYFNTVEIFIPVAENGWLDSKADNNKLNKTRIYITKGKIEAEIDASKVGETDKGYYSPKVTMNNGEKITGYRIVRADYASYSEDPTTWVPVDRKHEEADEASATVVAKSGLDMTADQFAAEFAQDKFNEKRWTLDKNASSETLEAGTYFYYMVIDYKDNTGKADKEIAVSPYITIFPDENIETSVRVYQLVKDTTRENTYVTYNKNTSVQYDVTLDAENNVTSVARRNSQDRFDYNGDNAQWTLMMAAATNLPVQYTSSTDYSPKEITGFSIMYGDTEVKQLASEANASSDLSKTYYAVKDMTGVTKTDADWYATFNAKATDNSNSQEVVRAAAVMEKTVLKPALPVFSLGEPSYELTQTGNANAVVNDTEKGAGLVEVENALINDFSVKVDVKAPRVEANAWTWAKNYAKACAVKVDDSQTSALDPKNAADFTLSLAHENPAEWMNPDWSAKTTTFAVSADTEEFYDAAMYETYPNEDMNKTLTVSGSRYTPELAPLIYRWKVLPDPDKNEWYEKLLMVNTKVDLRSRTASSLAAGEEFIKDGDNEYVIIKVNGAVKHNGYYDSESCGTPEQGSNLHHFATLEDEGNMIELASYGPVTWYATMDKDNWITKMPEVTFAVANFFEAPEQPAASPRKAPSRSQLAEGATHHLVYSNEAVANMSNIVTAVDQVEADMQWIEAGTGYFTVKAEGVAVYDINGVKMADSMGRYDAEAGVYLAVRGASAVKIYVK